MSISVPFKKIRNVSCVYTMMMGLSMASDVIQFDEQSPVLQQTVFQEVPVLSTVAVSKFIQQQYDLVEGKDLVLTGVALFGGTDLVSSVIKQVTQSIWSHCGLVFDDQNGDRYCLESTGSAGDVLAGHMPQVQIHKWDDVVKKYSGRVGHRAIILPGSSVAGDMGKNTPDYNNPIVRGLIGKPYETNILVLVSSVVRGNSVATPNPLFCSEMDAEYLQNVGYMSTDRLPDNYLPKDFAATDLTLLRVGLGDITQLKHSRGIIGKVSAIGWKICDRIEKILEKMM